MGEHVKTEQRGAVLVITIDRPKARNAVNRAVSLEMADALDALDGDDSLVVAVITGAGGNFCAGMDLKAFAAGERPEIDGRGFAAITERPPAKPVIAAVEGFALAGGCELALACDLIVAGESAEFGLPEATLGLVAGSGGLIRLPQRIPRQIALEIAITGRRVPATEAHHWGLVNRLTPDGEALGGAMELAEQITTNGPLAVQMTKRIMTESANWPADEVWDRQRPLVDSVLATNDAREGAVAFAERRPPRWTGT
jgi:enoyl-CoA hydratase